ncbi:hypothetical protein TNCV_2256151 [Trichonephila clavipes]|nr:hypothetical protein TNCV_2256151 [Trichonephila clavipes]
MIRIRIYVLCETIPPLESRQAIGLKERNGQIGGLLDNWVNTMLSFQNSDRNGDLMDNWDTNGCDEQQKENRSCDYGGHNTTSNGAIKCTILGNCE